LDLAPVPVPVPVPAGGPARPLRVALSLLSQDEAQYTGTWTLVRELLRRFRDPEHVSVDVLCTAATRSRLASQVGDGVALWAVRPLRWGGPRARRAALLAGLHAHPGWPPEAGPEASEVVHYPLTLPVPRCRLPHVVTLHDLQHRDLPDNFTGVQRAWRSLMYERAARRATVVIADSEHTRRRVIELLGVPGERILTCHLAVDSATFTPEAQPGDEEILAELNLPSDYLLYPASLWPHKNHRALLEAMRAMRDQSISLVLTGATFGREAELHRWISELGLGERVRHLGLVAPDRLPVLYRHARALAFPSSYEGFGMPPLEAMASGCPVASSLAASLSEVVGDAALPLDPADPEHMADALERLCSDESLRARLRRAGLDRVGAFSWDAAQAVHLDAYRLARELGRR
jgi:glycosyltransferase involved in cell wall biosynthesis